MLKLLSLEAAPFFQLEYQNAAPSGRGTVVERLPVLRGRVEGLPEGLDALLLTADLQGRAFLPADDGATRVVLLGEALVEAMLGLEAAGEVPALARTGAVLAGDLYTVPKADRRGGTGDVREVWLAFASAYAFAAGVAGNHDLFGQTRGEREAFRRQAGVHLLDSELRQVAGLSIAGVGGIPGDPAKPNRLRPEDFASAVATLAARQPDLLVLHSGPDVPEAKRIGSSVVREALRGAVRPWVVCGHCHWPTPRASLNGLEVLNVDGRALLLCRE